MCQAAWLAGVHAESPSNSDCSAAELLPDSIAVSAEIPDVGGVLQTVLKHPLRSRLEALPAFDAAMQSGSLGQLQMGVRAFEGSMSKPWHEAIATLTDRGLTIALDSADGGVAVLMRSSDQDLLERFRGFVLAFRQMQGAPAKQGEYRGFVADMVSANLKMVRIDDWMLLTNHSDLGKSIIDQYLDRNGQSLASNKNYTAARQHLDSVDSHHRAVSAIVDIQTLRDAGVAKNLFNEKTDNIAAEIVLGGVLANLRHAPFVSGQLDVSDDGLSLRLDTPHQRNWEAPREYFFGESELATAPPLLYVPNRLFAFSTHRDLSQMWLRSGDLVSDRAVDQLTVADTTLTTFFSGRDFGEDILGAFESDVQIVGMEQDFTDVLPQPAIKLPSFALQFQMKNPKETQPELRRVFQSFVGFLNVTGAQNGQPQLDLGVETVGDAQLVTATYVPDNDKQESRNERIHFNFSPTLGFAGQRIIFSSSTSLARTLISDDTSNEKVGGEQSNTRGKFEAATLKRILDANRSQLIANSMLEKGHSKEAAVGEISLLLELVGLIRDVRLNLDINDSHMTLRVGVDVQADSETP
ncbi:hypothetical protein CEE69_13580 [Rhodopirellula bahusiensis]|uniref:Uncharacterized protein n=1 Tax=Rhodopirellula bahusiensis TaxID=2014065 RepID=A0A2G1W798_9BACT|nr:hypothetical protein CEE69_13580 [Rhodopirellula bahusiensis]